MCFTLHCKCLNFTLTLASNSSPCEKRSPEVSTSKISENEISAAENYKKILESEKIPNANLQDFNPTVLQKVEVKYKWLAMTKRIKDDSFLVKCGNCDTHVFIGIGKTWSKEDPQPALVHCNLTTSIDRKQLDISNFDIILQHNHASDFDFPSNNLFPLERLSLRLQDERS